MRGYSLLVIGLILAGCAAGQPPPASGVPTPAPPPGSAPPYQEPPVKPDLLPEPGAHTCAVAPGTLLAATKSAVLRSVDGGRSWEVLFRSPMVSLHEAGELQCRPQAVWVLFTGGAGAGHLAHVVYRSTDAGHSFEPMLVSGMGAPEELRRLSKPWIDAYPGPFAALDADTAFFAGACPACGGGTASITRTFDGGQTWQKDPIPLVRQVTALSFVDARRGWAVGETRSGSLILATEDGGKTWRVQDPPEPAETLYPSVPLYPMTTAHETLSDQRAWLQVKGEAAAKVLAWYQTALPAHGWRAENTGLPADLVLLFSHEGQYLSLSGQDAANDQRSVFWFHLRTTREVTREQALLIARNTHRIEADWTATLIQDFETERYGAGVKGPVWLVEALPGNDAVWVDAITAEPFRIRE